MRISVIFLQSGLCLFRACARLAAQDPGARSRTPRPRARKLLKAEDELDNIQANSEATKASVDAMKADVTKLQQAER